MTQKQSKVNTLKDLITCESKIEETKTRMNNYLGEEKAKTIYDSIRKEIWDKENIDDIVEKTYHSTDLNKDEITEVTNQIINEKIVDESNKRQITKMHIIKKENAKKNIG